MDSERMLFLYDFLNRRTNAEKGVTIEEIQRYLAEEKNMERVSAATIRRDLERIMYPFLPHERQTVQVQRNPVHRGFHLHQQVPLPRTKAKADPQVRGTLLRERSAPADEPCFHQHLRRTLSGLAGESGRHPPHHR